MFTFSIKFYILNGFEKTTLEEEKVKLLGLFAVNLICIQRLLMSFLFASECALGFLEADQYIHLRYDRSASLTER